MPSLRLHQIKQWKSTRVDSDIFFYSASNIFFVLFGDGDYHAVADRACDKVDHPAIIVPVTTISSAYACTVPQTLFLTQQQSCKMHRDAWLHPEQPPQGLWSTPQHVTDGR